ncbi:MAG: universal stress protein [Phycisphaerales bacterium]|jgi:nucleotide-binding universal stress UspA family protein|nr:universal stress protein [Phycisphaerales bacterium]
MNILTATDGSPTGNAAVAWAAERFGRAGNRIRILHVIGGGHHQDEVLDAANAALTLMAAELNVNEGVLETAALPHAPAWEVLAAEADSWKADLLIVGCRGHAPLDWVRLGTTARRLVRTAASPVLTVPPTPSSDPGHTALHGLVCVDFSEESSLAISAAVRLLSGARDGGSLTLLHVLEQPNHSFESMGYGLLGVADDLLEHGKVEASRLIEGLAADARRGGLAVDAIVEVGSPTTTILNTAKRLGCDFIATGTRGKNLAHRMFIGSVATHLLKSHELPILTTRDVSQEQPVALSAHPAPTGSST